MESAALPSELMVALGLIQSRLDSVDIRLERIERSAAQEEAIQRYVQRMRDPQPASLLRNEEEQEQCCFIQ